MSDSKADLERKIIEDLKKSGFASELAALNVFISDAWAVWAGWTYFDEEENKIREIDIRAVQYVEVSMDPARPVVREVILADTKKSERPWIILGSGGTSPEAEFASGTLIKYAHVPIDEEPLYELLLTGALIKKLGWKGYGIHDADSKHWVQTANIGSTSSHSPFAEAPG